MSNLFERKTPLNPVTLTQRPFSAFNANKNSNNVFKPLEPNSFRLNKKRDFFSPTKVENKTFYKERNISEVHPLDFYTLGKIPPNTVYQNLEWNDVIKDNSNDIINRNALPTKIKKFNEIDLNKKFSNIYEENITESNYIEPIKVYKSYEKYCLPKYATNIGIYNLMKEKCFSRDIHSSITRGKCISKNEFIKQKERIMKKENLNLNNISCNKDTKFEEKKLEQINKNYKNERNKSKEIKEKIKSSSYSTGLIYKDPNDYSKQLLKNNIFYFDKNHHQMLKNRKWIIEDKK